MSVDWLYWVGGPRFWLSNAPPSSAAVRPLLLKAKRHSDCPLALLRRRAGSASFPATDLALQHLPKSLHTSPLSCPADQAGSRHSHPVHWGHQSHQAPQSRRVQLLTICSWSVHSLVGWVSGGEASGEPCSRSPQSNSGGVKGTVLTDVRCHPPSIRC